MPVKVYDPASVVLLFNGIPIRGYAPGTFISATQNDQTFRLYVGVSGEATRGMTNNASGRIQVTLQQSSTSNDVLSAFHAADTVATRGLGVSAVQVKDLNGSTLVLANTAWIVQYPDISFASSVGNRVWTIETDSIAFSAGGSLSVGA